MKLYYRISDKSYPKTKLIGATKEVCFTNFIRAFAEVIFGGEGPPAEDHTPPMKVICDNCERNTAKMVQATGLPYTITTEGNAGSLWKTLVLALEECEDDDLVYFCEDDYLHLGSAPKLLREGIQHTDYVTLYDHPDKYTKYYNNGEFSKVIRTASSHWRYTASTCMTFGAKIRTLKKDMKIWEEYTSGDHPFDHDIFMSLNNKDRRLAVCIPGVACHTDLSFSGMINQMSLDPWAIDMMVAYLNRECEELAIAQDKGFEYLQMAEPLVNKTKSEQLLLLDAIKKHFSQ
jgi:hypothetical protein